MIDDLEAIEAMGLGLRKFDRERDWARVMEIGFKIYGSIPLASATAEEFAEKSEWYLKTSGIDGFVAEREGNVLGVYLFCRVGDIPSYYAPDGTMNSKLAANIVPILSEKGLHFPAPDDLAELLTGTDPRHTMMESFLTMAACKYAERAKVGIVTNCVVRADDRTLYYINLFFGFERGCEFERTGDTEYLSILMMRPRNAPTRSMMVQGREGTVYACEPGAQR